MVYVYHLSSQKISFLSTFTVSNNIIIKLSITLLYIDFSSSFGNSGGSGGQKTVPSSWGVDFFWNNPISKISSSYGIKQFCMFLF